MWAAEKIWPRARRLRLPRASQTCPGLWVCTRRRTQSLWQSPAAAFFSEPSPRWEVQWMVSSGLRNPSKSSSSSSAFSLPESLSVSSSLISNTGSDTTYFSLAQLPRSRSRQRSLQKGKSALISESVGALQIGQQCFMGPSPFELSYENRSPQALFSAPALCSSTCNEPAPQKLGRAAIVEVILPQDAERRSGSNTMELFGWRKPRDGRRIGDASPDGLRKDLHDAPNQVIRIGLDDFYVSNVARLGGFAARQFDVG